MCFCQPAEWSAGFPTCYWIYTLTPTTQWSALVFYILVTYTLTVISICLTFIGKFYLIENGQIWQHFLGVKISAPDPVIFVIWCHSGVNHRPPGKAEHITHIPPLDGENDALQHTKIVGSAVSLVTAHFCNYEWLYESNNWNVYTHTQQKWFFMELKEGRHPCALNGPQTTADIMLLIIVCSPCIC